MGVSPRRFPSRQEPMITHRILVERTDSSWRVWQSNASLGLVSQPIYGTARLLLELGLAQPRDMLEVYVDRDDGEEIIGRTIIGAGARLAMRVA